MNNPNCSILIACFVREVIIDIWPSFFLKILHSDGAKNNLNLSKNTLQEQKVSTLAFGISGRNLAEGS